MDACHCKDYTRAAILRQTAARAGAGAGLRAIEPGMPLPAGTGLSRRSFLARSSGLALAVFGGGALAPERVRGGHRRRDGRGAARSTVLVSIFLSGGLDTLSLLAPVDDPAYQALRPTLKLAPNPAHAFAADPLLQWHPAALPLKSLNESGRLTVVPAIGYSTPNQSHFTSRHFYEVGELNESRPGRLAGPLAGPQRPRRQPAPGPLDGRDPRARARRGEHARGRRRVADELLAQHGRRRDGRPREHEPGLRGDRPARRRATRQLAAARHAAAQVVGIQDSLSPLFGQAITDTPAGVDVPGQQRLRQQAQGAGEDAAHGPADPLRRARRQRRLRHARQPGRDAHEQPEPVRGGAAGLPGRPRGARWRPAARRSPTACSCTSGASSGAARPRTARAPTTARRARRC